MKYTLYEYMYGWMHWVSLTETLKLKKRTKQPNFTWTTKSRETR